MKLFKDNGMKIFWFLGGFAIGFTLISLGHASVSKQSAPVSEIRGGKVAVPQVDQDLAHLNSLESRYSESDEQQQRIKRSARLARNAPVKKVSHKRSKQD